VNARSFEQAVEMVKQKGAPSFTSFDHDLGPGDRTGHSFAEPFD
jgi:hypothetical protein